MTPLLLAAAGVIALAAAAAVLLTFGPRYRVGRLLAASRRITVAEAIEAATAGRDRYVRIDGRIDSDAEFTDADHRPLVLRRTTLQVRGRRGPWRRWVTFESSVETVPFVIRDGLDEVDVDGRELADGLVVVPRESLGAVADLGERAPDGLAPDTPARAIVEQVSSVEHATVLGVPVADPAGRTRLAPGLGRPLVLTTLEAPEAMRILAGGDTARPRLALALLVLAAVLLVAALAWWFVDALLATGATALAASPSPTIGTGTDTRSPGVGPGLVGDPGFALAAVIAIGAASALATLALVRLTATRTHARRPRD